jgi:ABC-type lipoprotein release transport system permease subunit
VLLSERDFRALFALPADVVNDIAVSLAPDAEAAAVRQQALRVLPGAPIVTRQEILETAASFLDWSRGVAAVLVLAMALALVIVAADTPAALSVEEQREMRILRALGWSKTNVLVAKTWEPLCVSIAALLIGMLAVSAHVYLYQAAFFAPVLHG